MLGALSLAFVDSVNLLLIGVIVAVGIMVPRHSRTYAAITALLIAGDWLGVASLALLMLAIFDGLGPLVHDFVDGPIFGVLLLVTGLATAVLALKGGDNSKLIDAILKTLRKPNALTCLLYTSPSPRDLSTSRMPSSA